MDLEPLCILERESTRNKSLNNSVTKELSLQLPMLVETEPARGTMSREWRPRRGLGKESGEGDGKELDGITQSSGA